MKKSRLNIKRNSGENPKSGGKPVFAPQVKKKISNDELTSKSGL